MKIIPIYARTDNYIWLAYNTAGDAFIVDPGESQPILDYLQDKPLTLKAILLTHAHEDHTAGVKGIQEAYPNVETWGPEEVQTQVDNLDHVVHPGDDFTLLGQEVRVLLTAGHTTGHVSYIMGDVLFCGDALFKAGCGRVFTDDYEAAYEAMQVFKGLPDNMKVYAGHEYTLDNLTFALQEEPDQPELQKAYQEAKAQRDHKEPTLPSTIQYEKALNPFIKAKSLKEFTRLRKARNHL